MKKIFLFTVLTMALALSGASPILAECSQGQCPYMKHGHYGKEEQGCPITGKLKKKASFYLEHQKELALTDEQVAAIKDIKVAAKKSHIRQMAEMQIFHLDIQHKMSQDPVDVEGIHAMMDQMAAGMTASAKEQLAAFVKLKALLTPEQTAKAKEIWMEKKE